MRAKQLFKSSTKSRSSTAKVKCQYCQLSFLEKSYKRHLERKHADKNQSDRRSFTQKKLSNFLVPGSQAEEGGHHDINEEDNENIEGEGNDDSEDDGMEEDLTLEEEVPPTPDLDNNNEGLDLEDTDIGLEVENNNNDGNTENTEQSDSLASNFDELTPDRASITERRNIENVGSRNISDNIEKKLDSLIEKVNNLSLKINYKENERATPNKSSDDVYKENIQEMLRNLYKARSINEITELGFVFIPSQEKVFCSVCEVSDSRGFNIDVSSGLTFLPGEKMSRSFSGLKSHIKEHLTSSNLHSSKIQEARALEEKEKQLKSKNHEAGMNLGRLCMQLFISGRPYSDYETNVLTLKLCGSFVGELNHSRKFPPAFRPFVTRAVRKRMKKFLVEPLEVTGHLPPVVIMDDKATYRHRTRHFLGIVTVVPGGEHFLQAFSCGQPIVEGNSGLEITQTMKKGFDSFGISPEQIESFVADGQYIKGLGIMSHLGNISS